MHGPVRSGSASSKWTGGWSSKCRTPALACRRGPTVARVLAYGSWNAGRPSLAATSPLTPGRTVARALLAPCYGPAVPTERASMDLKTSGASRYTIAIVDDHPLVREGLAARISAQPDMEVCGEADDIESAIEMIVATRPSLVIVDIALRDGHGIDLIKRIVAAGIDTRML